MITYSTCTSCSHAFLCTSSTPFTEEVLCVCCRDRAQAARKALEKKGSRNTSKFRGVTHHIRTGRWESHIWQGGKQIYLGGFDTEEQAAMAYDIAAVKFRGKKAQTNYNMCNYKDELSQRNRVRGTEVHE